MTIFIQISWKKKKKAVRLSLHSSLMSSSEFSLKGIIKVSLKGII